MFVNISKNKHTPPNIALEINIGNYKSGLDFPNPHFEIWDMYRELGGKYIQIGSDAHSHVYVGNKFDLIKHCKSSNKHPFFLNLED